MQFDNENFRYDTMVGRLSVSVGFLIALPFFVDGWAAGDVINVVGTTSNGIDAFVQQNEADTAHDFANTGACGTNAVIEVDARAGSSNSAAHGLLAFTDFIGTGAGQVAAGSTVTNATLSLWYVNDNRNNDVYFYRMTSAWDETVTWNSIGGSGVDPGTNADAASLVTANFGSIDPVTVTLDVTDVVNDWVQNGVSNYGWGIINSNRNGFQFAALENTTGTGAHTPTLNITFTPTPEPATLGLLSLGGILLLIKRRKRALRRAR